MTTSRRIADPRSAESETRRRHRTRILATLLGVCRELERLKITPEGKRACREVGGFLAAEIEREAPRGASRRAREGGA